MAKLRLVQLNAENLYSRYALLDDPTKRNNPHIQIIGVADIDYGGNPLSEATTQIQRNNTARVILECNPDILALEEVENLWTLRLFNDEYLNGYFDRMVMIEGNDGRGIDVALCIKDGCNVEIKNIRTHIDDVYQGQKDTKHIRVNRYYNVKNREISVQNALFSRDCLEIDVNANNKTLTFLVNHFKAQSKETKSGNDKCAKIRNAQAKRVAELVQDAKTNNRLPIVIGDLNEDWNLKQNLAPLKDLVTKGVLLDPFAEVENNWTHFYSITKEKTRLDYILVDNLLQIADKYVFRKGISLMCPMNEERFPTIGYVGTEASDHSAVVVVIEV